MTENLHFVIATATPRDVLQSRLQELWPQLSGIPSILTPPSHESGLLVSVMYSASNSERRAALELVDYLLSQAKQGVVVFYRSDVALYDRETATFHRPIRPVEVLDLSVGAIGGTDCRYIVQR